MSDLTNQEKLEEVYRLAVENNHILHGMRNRERVANAFRVIYWIVIIGSLLGAYIYVKPLIDLFLTNKTKMDETLTQFQELQKQYPEMNPLQELKKLLQTGTTTPQ